jgi:hypothetical protein
MTNATYETFLAHLDQVAAGRRGSVAIPDFARGRCGVLLRETATALGFHVEPHGKYGYCAFRVR